LGKTAGKDLQAKKATYPSIWGIDESRRQAQQLIDTAKLELAPLGEKAIPLMAIADFVTARTN
jgi:geranylgeranyl diphosphate synthase, type II